MTTGIKSITLIGRKWFDKVNGNTYHSARAFIDGELVAVAPFQYGYGDQWLWSIADELEKNGFMPERKHYNNGGAESYWQYFRDGRRIPIVLDCSNVTKKECKRFGEKGE